MVSTSSEVGTMPNMEIRHTIVSEIDVCRSKEYRTLGIILLYYVYVGAHLVDDRLNSSSDRYAHRNLCLPQIYQENGRYP